MRRRSKTTEAGLILVKISVAGVKMVGEDWASIWFCFASRSNPCNLQNLQLSPALVTRESDFFAFVQKIEIVGSGQVSTLWLNSGVEDSEQTDLRYHTQNSLVSDHRGCGHG